MTAFGGGELATEWVTLLPETATLARKLREFRPAPIKVKVEADYGDMEREGRVSGKRTGQHIDTEVDRETRRTGHTVASNIADGMDSHEITAAARRAGRAIRTEVEGETRKIDFKTSFRGLFSGIGVAAAGSMQLIRNIGSIAIVMRVAAKFAKAFSISLLAGATAVRAFTGAGLAKFGTAMGFTAKQADKLARTVARVTSAMLVAAATFKFLQFFLTASKVMGALTIGAGLLTGLIPAAISLFAQWGQVAVTALMAIGSAAGIAAAAAVGLLGPAIGVVKIAFQGMSDAAKEFNKQFADTDKAFNQDIGKRMGPLLTAVHDLKLGITDAFTKAFQPAFGWLGNTITMLMPKFKGLATTMGNLGGEIAGGLQAKAIDGTFDRLFAASDKFFQSFLGESGIGGLTTGLIDFVTTAAEAFSGVGTNINELLLKAGNFLRNVTGDQMKAVFQNISNVLRTIWAVLGPILNGVKQFGDVMRNDLAPGVKAFGGGIGDAIPGLVEMAKILMPALSNVLEKLAPALPALVSAFRPWATILAVVAPVVADIVTKLVPFAPVILALVTAFKAATIALALYNTAMLLFTNIGKIARTVQWAFNAALAANPIGLVVAAIAAVVAGLTLFFTKTEYGRQLWDKIWTSIKTTAMAVWDWLKVEGGKLWNDMKPALESLGKKAVEVFGQLKSSFQELWPKIQPVVAAIAKFGLEIQKFNWTVLINALKILGTTIGWLATNVAVPYFTMIVNQAKNLWTGLKAVFGFIKGAWDVLWFGIKLGWAIGEAVFNAIGAVASAVWNSVLKPTFDALGAAWDFVGGKLQWFGDLWTTIWDGLKAGVQAVWDFLKPVRDWLGDFFDSIGAIGEKAATAIKNAWNGLTNILKSPLHALGSFLQGLPSSILGIEIPFVADLKGWGASLAGLKEGGVAGRNKLGMLYGPGTGTSDDILGLDGSGIPTARVSAGEGVVPADVLATPEGRALFGMLLGMREGGKIKQGVITWPPEPVGPTDKSRPGGVPDLDPGFGGSIALPDWSQPGTKFGAPPVDWWSKPVNPEDVLFPDYQPPWIQDWMKKHGKRIKAYNVGGQVGSQGSGLNPGAQSLADMIKRMFGISNIGGRRSEDGYGEHSSGNAIDVMIPNWQSPEGVALGNKIAGFVQTNARALGLDGMIWQQKSYGYGGSLTTPKEMTDRGSPTQNHMDHLHIMLGKGRGSNAAAVGLPSGPIIDNVTGGSTSAGSASMSYFSGGSGSGTGSYVIDPKKVREGEDRVTDMTNQLDIKQKRLDEYLAKQAAGDKVSATTIEAARDAVTKQSRDLEQAKADLETTKQGTYKEGKAAKGTAEGGSDDWSSVGGMIFSGFLESFGLDGSVFKNLLETPGMKSVMGGLNWGMSLASTFMGDQSGNPPQDLGLGGGGGPSGILGAGADVLAGIGEQAGVQFPAAHGDQALAGGTPGPGNVFDLRGSQLGVSPGAFEDKMGEMTAASKRHPTLGPG